MSPVEPEVLYIFTPPKIPPPGGGTHFPLEVATTRQRYYSDANGAAAPATPSPWCSFLANFP